MILIFKYNNKYLKFTPNNKDTNLIEYADTNLPNGTPYKILENIDNLNDQDYDSLFVVPDGFSNNTLF